MTEKLNELFNNQGLSEEIKESLKKSFEEKVDARVSEIRENIAAEVRDDLANVYDSDKAGLVEAMHNMIRDQLKESLTDLNREKKALIQERVQYKRKIYENTSKYKNIIKKMLTSEIVELREDRKAMAEKCVVAEKFIVDHMTRELKDFRSEKAKLVEDRVEFNLKSRKELKEAKQIIARELAEKVNKFVPKILQEELSQLKEELAEAKENNLGRKIFEAYAAEYNTSFHNERSEIKKLHEAIKERDIKLEEAAKEVEKRDIAKEQSNKRARIAENRLQRDKHLKDLLSPLIGDKRKCMEDLLRREPTEKLNEMYTKYLPMLTEDKHSTPKNMLSEGTKPGLKAISGNRERTIVTEKQQKVSELNNDYISSFKSINSKLNAREQVPSIDLIR